MDKFTPKSLSHNLLTTSIELIAGEGRGDSSGKGKAEASTDFTQLGSPKNVVGNNGVAGYGEVVVLKMSGWGGELI